MVQALLAASIFIITCPHLFLENACSAKLKEMDEALDQLRFKVSKATPDVRETYKP